VGADVLEGAGGDRGRGNTVADERGRTPAGVEIAWAGATGRAKPWEHRGIDRYGFAGGRTFNVSTRVNVEDRHGICLPLSGEPDRNEFGTQ
jgi:hypothetical protein